ncbi:MAG: GNAT family N-acetyltransferase [Deltaproteobacteria bacterium]
MIRPATPADLAACAAIINAYIDATDWLPRTSSREEIDAIFTPDLLIKRKVMVAELDGKIVGYMSMGEDGFVPAIYLASEARGQGIGKQFIEFAKAAHPAEVRLDCFLPNVAAQRFYAREGFTEIEGERFTEEEGVLKMRLRWRP